LYGATRSRLSLQRTIARRVLRKHISERNSGNPIIAF
jgi:hypothetical protein